MKMMATATLFVLLAVAGGSLGQDYCKICSNHTMCIYKQGPGPQCQPLVQAGVNGRQRKEIVDLHNECRKRIIAEMEAKGGNVTQPPLMTWDNELAKVAQRWANQCTPGHDSCRNVERFSYVGQNIVIITTTPNTSEPEKNALRANWRRALTGCELRSSRYSRAAWAFTAKLGCGFAQFLESGEITSLYVCNYAPGGDDEFGPDAEYKPEVACSQCHNYV